MCHFKVFILRIKQIFVYKFRLQTSNFSLQTYAIAMLRAVAVAVAAATVFQMWLEY